MTQQRTFAELVNEAMARKFRPDGSPWVDDTLSGAIGLIHGDKRFNAKQVWRLRRGERRNLSRELVARLIQVLDLDPDEAWAASGLLPPEVTAEELRELRRFRALAASGQQLVAAVGAASDVPDPTKSGWMIDAGRRGWAGGRRRRSDRALQKVA